MSKVGLLKDSDFKCLHNARLPVTKEDLASVEAFVKTIEHDVRFLENLRIMDYSLFLIVIEVPGKVDVGNSESIKISCQEDFDFKPHLQTLD
jgi:hypothetical protein